MSSFSARNVLGAGSLRALNGEAFRLYRFRRG